MQGIRTSLRWPDDHLLGPPSTFPRGVTIFRQGDDILTTDLIQSGVVTLKSRRSARDIHVSLKWAGVMQLTGGMRSVVAQAPPMDARPAANLQDADCAPVR
jgi:hypothetical protein